MKISGLRVSLGLLIASLVHVSAQVSVEVTQDQQQFLAGEELKVAVRITNLSGQDLQLGAEDDWLTFALESREGIVVPKLGEAPVEGSFLLPSSKVAIKRVDLAPYFGLTQSGTYQIVATVRIRGWSRELTSPPKSFDIIQGAKLWEREVGIPKSASATNAEPEIRRYVLQQANYLRGQIRLYLRVMNAFGKPIRVVAVGPMVSFGRPEPQVDKQSNLHVLCQDGASSFNYTVCNLEGEVIMRRTYDFSDSRPRLRLDDDGNISVVGGTRRIATNDIPAAKSDDSNDLSETTNSPPAGQLSATKPAQ
jgi:hypothetical protein